MNAPNWNFEGENVYVSAGAWGIGRAVVSLFARAGARVVFGDIDVLHGEELQEILSVEGCEVRFLEADFTHDQAWPRMLAVEPAWEPSIVVSNAGISGLMAIDNFDMARYDRIQAINQRAAFVAAKLAVPAMKRRGRGAIVYVGSIMAQAIFEHSSAYVATKSAIEGMTRALAVDLGPARIRVNCVMPGFTRVGMNDPQRDRSPPRLWTAFAAHFARELEAQHALQQPLATGTDCTDVAQAVAFLCSDAARCITGAAVPVDGALGLKVAYDPSTRLRLEHWTDEMELWVQQHSFSEGLKGKVNGVAQPETAAVL